MRSLQATACAAAAVLTLTILAPGSVAQAEDFLRADANEDGVVSVADSYYIGRYLFRGGPAPGCQKTADFDDDGDIDLTDEVSILNFLILGRQAPLAPFPDLGSDPTDDPLSCLSYGGESALDDPAAEVRILDVSAPGGDDRFALIIVEVSSTAPVVGLAGAIRIDPEVIYSASKPTDLTGTSDGEGFANAKVVGDELRFGMLGSITGDPNKALPGGDDITVLEIKACLREGATAGDSPLTLLRAELVDAASARRIEPARSGATLTVENDLGEDVGCRFTPPVDPPDNPENVEAMFKVSDAVGVRGGTVDVPLILGSNGVIQAFSFSIDFEEDVLQGLSIDPVYELPTGEDYAFSVFDINNNAEVPGSGGVDEGFLVGAAVFHLTDFSNSLQPSEGTEVLNFSFSINPDTTKNETEIRFLDGGVGQGQPVKNLLTVGGAIVLPEVASSFVFIDGFLQIVGDVSFFRFFRGDSNQDHEVDIADGIHVLNYLFLKGEEPGCMDAADADDSGDVNLSDAVAVFGYLFSGDTTLPSPVFPNCGVDPTPDELPDCAPGASCQ